MTSPLLDLGSPARGLVLGEDLAVVRRWLVGERLSARQAGALRNDASADEIARGLRVPGHLRLSLQERTRAVRDD